MLYQSLYAVNSSSFIIVHGHSRIVVYEQTNTQETPNYACMTAAVILSLHHQEVGLYPTVSKGSAS